MTNRIKSNAHTPHKQHIGRGALFAFLAAISFTLMSLFGKLIGDQASTDIIVFSRFFISLLLLSPWIIQNPKKILRISQPPFTIIFRSLFTLLAFASFFYSLKFLSLPNALLLKNTTPLFVPILAWISARHQTPYKVWIGIIMGFIGVLLVLKPAAGFFQTASLIGLASGLFGAIAILMIRKLTKTTPTTQILFYNFLICSLATALFLPLEWKPLDIHTLTLLLAVGLTGAAYQLCSTLSYAKTPVRIASPLMFLCIFFGVLLDWLIWHQIPDKMTLFGMMCVIIGGVITIYFGQKEIMKGINS